MPDMIEVDVTVDGAAPARSLHFQVARQQQLTPMIIAAGLTQAIVGSNDAGMSNGFRLSSDVLFSAGRKLASRSLYAGPQAFTAGLEEFVKGLSQDLQNPYETLFPRRVSFAVEALDRSPAVTLDRFELSRARARGGETIEAELSWRDYQGAAHAAAVEIPVDPQWTGKRLEVILAPGRAMDELTGRSREVAAAQLRSFDAYLSAMREDRPEDGVCLAVLEDSPLFTDQTESTRDLPASLVRMAAAADGARFRERPALRAVWERHLLAGKLASGVMRRTFQVAD
jgi:hypothetical protein